MPKNLIAMLSRLQYVGSEVHRFGGLPLMSPRLDFARDHIDMGLHWDHMRLCRDVTRAWLGHA